MKKTVITISRQFGSGGRTIGRELANRLGIPFYDQELVDQIALESGFNSLILHQQCIKLPGSLHHHVVSYVD